MKSKYLSSAFWLILSSVVVKIIGAVYKIPLTAYIGAVGRGYFSVAYNLYMPIHAIIMGAFPIALSRLVSKYYSSNNYRMISSLKKGSMALFSLVGFAGAVIISLAAKPYCVYIASSPKSIYSVLVLAPSILFSCLSSAYRGCFEGFLNMKPTAASQTLEALFKMIFGLLFAKKIMLGLMDIYRQTGMVFDIAAPNESRALSLIYPFSTAGAMLGVTLGSFVSFIYLLIYYRINKNGLIKGGALKEGIKALSSFSFPIVVSCGVQSVFQFADTATVQMALSRVDKALLLENYSGANIDGEDIISYVYGIFNASLDFKNLIPGITMALGVTCVPAICREFESKNKLRFEKLVNDVYKYTVLFSLLMGIALFIGSEEILKLFYGKNAQDIAVYSNALVKSFAITSPVYCLASTAVFVVQAIGCPEKSIKPYIISGAIRAVLNLILIQNEKLVLFGAVISGAVGYFVLFYMNIKVLIKRVNIKINANQVFIKPLIIGFSSYFVALTTVFTNNYIKNDLIYLLIKISVFAAIFCILCFLLKTLKFDEIFLPLKSKKNGLNT